MFGELSEFSLSGELDAVLSRFVLGLDAIESGELANSGLKSKVLLNDATEFGCAGEKTSSLMLVSAS